MLIVKHFPRLFDGIEKNCFEINFGENIKNFKHQALRLLIRRHLEMKNNSINLLRPNLWSINLKMLNPKHPCFFKSDKIESLDFPEKALSL